MAQQNQHHVNLLDVVIHLNLPLKYPEPSSRCKYPLINNPSTWTQYML